LFAELGVLIPLPEELIDVAMALMSCGPAFWALVVEAQVDAGVRRGLTPERAAEMVVTTMAGTARLLRLRDMDTLRVRREVTSPGGSTARGLAALERGGVRAAFADAMTAVVGE
jgi:pyrroline-5-carboxylate reductase